MHNSSLHTAQTASILPPVSEEYSDIILRRTFSPPPDEQYLEQIVNAQYSILYAPLTKNLFSARDIGYSGVPKLFTFLNTASLEASGILQVQTQPFLNLRGSGVLVGFLDSGIDYTHPAFRKPDGSTRILGIWDQTDASGTPPLGLSYGSAYSEAQINAALRLEDPRTLVPEQDESGHGTAVAGIACGSTDPESGFTGAAPESSLLVVRLKPAKQYLRRYFLIPEDAAAFQENDLMLGVRYLTDTAARLRLPLVICCSLGTNQGGHTGDTPLEQVLSVAQLQPGTYVAAGTGNEAGMAHHFYGKPTDSRTPVDAEILVGDAVGGFTAELWANPLELYSIGFVSPLGETIQPVYHGHFTFRDYTFPLEQTKISVYYTATEAQSGQQVAMIQIAAPTPGLWRLRIQNRTSRDGSFHLWLPVTGLVPPDVRFTAPNPDTTLVIPSCAEPLITVSTYNGSDGTLFLNSGRGYTRNGIVKPDFASPGVGLAAPRPSSPERGSSYGPLTGSSAASALCAGSAALLAEWGVRRFQTRYLTAQEMKNLFLRGTVQSSSYIYPNREWGYGTMNVYRIFEALGQS